MLRLRFNGKFLKKTRFYKPQGRNKACKKKRKKAYPCERRLVWDLDTLSAARGDCNDVLCGFWIRLLGKSCDFKESPKVYIDLGGQFERSWRAPNLSVLYTITTNLQDYKFAKNRSKYSVKTLKHIVLSYIVGTKIYEQPIVFLTFWSRGSRLRWRVGAHFVLI